MPIITIKKRRYFMESVYLFVRCPTDGVGIGQNAFPEPLQAGHGFHLFRRRPLVYEKPGTLFPPLQAVHTGRSALPRGESGAGSIFGCRGFDSGVFCRGRAVWRCFSKIFSRIIRRTIGFSLMTIREGARGRTRGLFRCSEFQQLCLSGTISLPDSIDLAA